MTIRPAKYPSQSDDGSYGLPWPIGTKIRFTADGGLDHELEEAFEVMKVGDILTVTGGAVYGFNAVVEVGEHEGLWNTSMFDEV